MRCTILLAILVACGGNGTPAPAGKNDAPPLKAEVIVLVRNARGELVEGATVEPGGATSDSAGRAAVELDAGIETVLRISKPGHAPQVMRVTVTDTVVMPTALIERANPVQIVDAAAGGTAAGADGARVTLPANALVNGAGQVVSGAVDVFLTPVDITDDRRKKAFPGLYEEEGGDALLSYGCVDITFEQSGEELDLAPGVTATIDIPIYVTAKPDGTLLAEGDTIPLWSLDESTGLWKAEGTGTVTRSGSGLVLRGTVSHFSWWNCDVGWPLRPWILTIDAPAVVRRVALRAKVSSGGAQGPRSNASRSVDARSETVIELPANLEVELVATALDGWLQGTVTVAADEPGERITLKLEPRSVLQPGDRFRGSMETVGEMAPYIFTAFADETIRIAVYPAADLESDPGISGDMEGTVILKGIAGMELARATFSALGAGRLEVQLPDDGLYTIEVIADGSVPGWYVGTTSLAIPEQNFDTELVYKVRDGDLFHVHVENGLPGDPVQINPDRNGRLIFNFDLVPSGGVLYTFNRRTTPPDLFLAHAARPGIATMLNPASDVPFGSFGVGQFAASAYDPTKVLYTVTYSDSTGALYLVDTDEPGVSRRLSDSALLPFHGRVAFQFVRGGRSVVYTVETNSNMFPVTRESFIVDIDNPDNPVALNGALESGASVQAFGPGGTSPEGREFVYVAGDLVSRAELYLVDVFDPGTATRLSDPTKNARVRSPSWLSNSRTVFFLSNTGANFVNELFMVPTRNPGDVQTVNAPSMLSINSYAVSPTTSRVAYAAGSGLHIVDLLNPGVSTPVAGASSSNGLVFTPDGTHLLVSGEVGGKPQYALVEVDNPTNVTQMLPTSAAELASEQITLTLDGAGFVVFGDLDGTGKNALYLISFSLPGIAVEVSGDHGQAEIERFDVR